MNRILILTNVTTFLALTIALLVAVMNRLSVKRLRKELALAHRKWGVFQAIADYDELTELYSRSYMVKALEGLIRDRRSPSSAVLFIDVNKFKPINDTYGHEVGDRCLTAIAQTIMESIRDSDVAGRYGGDEFVAILHNVTPEVVSRVCHRIKEKVSEIRLQAEGETISVSVAIGSVVKDGPWPEGTSVESIVIMADGAMYADKEASRG